MKPQLKAFSLIEILIYVGILGIVGTFLGGILVSVTRVENKQTSSGEVSQQLNFVLNNIQRIIRDSSVVDMDSGVSSSTLILRMEDPDKDKTLIYLNNNRVMIKEGDSTAVSLTSSAVKVDSLSFYKISSYPGHDSVQIDIAMSYNTDNPARSFTQKLSSAVARVSAATFDADLIPGASNNYDLGGASLRWKNLYLSGDLTVGAKTTLGNLTADPTGVEGMIYYNTVSKTFRAYANGAWTNLGSSGPWTVSGNNIYNNNVGNVGVGITTPTKKLDVVGEIRNTINGIEFYTVPKGSIIIWSGTNENIPSGWQLCDGTNGTPDLRNSNLTAYNGEIGLWSLGISLPAPRNFAATVVANGYVYVMGGSPDETNINAVNTVYYAKLYSNGLTGNWNTTTPLPENLVLGTASTNNEYIYFLGGSNGAGVMSSVYYAKINNDGTLGAWTTGTVMPDVRYALTSTIINGYLYAINGATLSANELNTIFYTKLNSDGSYGAWTSTTSGQGHSQHGSVVANGYMYIIGGYNKTVSYAKINADGSFASWSTTTNFPIDINNGFLVANGDYIYQIGGYNNISGSQSTIYYAEPNSDGTIDDWLTATSLPAARSRNMSVVDNDYIYAIGGSSASTAYFAPLASIAPIYIMKL